MTTPALALPSLRAPNARSPAALTLVAGLVGGAALASAIVVVMSPLIAEPGLTAAHRAYMVAASGLVGVLWLIRRPASAMGWWLVAAGAGALLISWEASPDPLLHSLGVASEAPLAILVAVTFLVYPSGRFRGRWDRALALVITTVTLVGFSSWVFTAPVLQGAGPLGRCLPECPRNALWLAEGSPLADQLGSLETWSFLLGGVAIIAVFVGRTWRANRIERPRYLALALTSLLWLVTLVVTAASILVFQAALDVLRVLGLLSTLASFLLPIGFALAIAIADLYAARAERRLLDHLAEGLDRGRWRVAITDALDDPGARFELLTTRDPRRVSIDAGGRFSVDAHGDLVLPVVARGGSVALITTDASLVDDPALLEAVRAASKVALEHGMLEQDLRTSRSRIVVAGDSERRRIGRDLHDGAQQRLVALRVHLGLLGERLSDPGEIAALQRAEEELDQALEEIRGLAHGLYPQSLARYGVAESLTTLFARSGVPVTVVDEGIGRLPEEVEATIYFVCLEAVQNASKHAGAGATATVTLSSEDHHVRFRVDDDGAGFDPATVEPGVGVANMTDRVAACGGRLEIDSAPGRGTCVAGVIPR